MPNDTTKCFCREIRKLSVLFCKNALSGAMTLWWLKKKKVGTLSRALNCGMAIMSFRDSVIP